MNLNEFKDILEKIDFIMTNEYYIDFLQYFSIASLFAFVKSISLDDLKKIFEKIKNSKG